MKELPRIDGEQSSQNMYHESRVSSSQFSPAFTSSITTNCRNSPRDVVLDKFVTMDKSISVLNHTKSISDNTTSGCSNTHANFLYVYFVFSYYLCLTPFRLKKVTSSTSSRESDHPTFEIHTYLPQKIICGIANFLALLRYVVELRKCFQEVKREDPISFFKLFEGCSSVVFKSVILRCFWKKQRQFLQIIRFLENPHILPYNKFKMQSIPTIAGLCTFYVIIGFMRMITGSTFLRPSFLDPAWSWSLWASRLVAEARYSFFLSNQSHIDYVPNIEDITVLDSFIAVITGFTFQCRFIAGYFVDVGILLCVLTLWAPVAGFANSISDFHKKHETENRSDNECQFGSSLTRSSPTMANHSYIDMQQQTSILKQYKALKILSELIGEANGATILPFISEAVFGYAIFFDEVLITKDFIHRLVLICFYFCAVSILLFSADICRKVQCMKLWLWDEERFATFSHQKLLLLLHDLSTNSVGITASGIFTVDYYLVGSMISVLITLFIIRLQYQSMDN